MEVVLRCENDVQGDTLTVGDCIMLYVVCLAFHAVVIIVSRFIVGYTLGKKVLKIGHKFVQTIFLNMHGMLPISLKLQKIMS